MIQRPQIRHPVPYLAAPGCLVVVLAVVLATGWGGPGVVRVVDDVAVVALAAYATFCAAMAAGLFHGRSRRAWATMALALGLWAIGELLWLVDELILHRAPFPSPADFFYLGYTVVAAVAMAHFPTGSAVQSRLRLVLDGLIVALCLFLLAWTIALNHVYETYREDRVALALALLYPVADLVVLTVAVVVLARAEGRLRIVLGLLTAAFMMVTITDSAFAYLVAVDRYDTGNLIDIGWAAALFTFCAAANLSRRPPNPMQQHTISAPPSKSWPWLPYLPLLLAGTAGPWMIMSGLERIVVPLVVIAVCTRQALTVWDDRRLLAAAAQQALRDPLTGLANLTLFHDRLAHAMTLNRRDGRSVAVVSLDLDDFKLVNDSLGHQTGDRLLVKVGKRLTGCMRPGDTVARPTGDQFVLLLEGPLDESRQVAQRVARAFDEPFVIDGQEMLMCPSIGMATTSTEEPRLTPDALVHRADLAMYAAKRQRSSGVHTFDLDMIANASVSVDVADGAFRQPSRGAAQVRLLGELRHAIDNGALDVVYQPKVELSTELIVGVEALLRWPHPLLGELRPDAFLSLVRQHGLMRSVTDLVLDRVLDDAACWASRGVATPVAVNLFAPSLRDTQLPLSLSRALADRDLSAGMLTVEITEDLVLNEVSQVTAVLHRLRADGIRVAIDDFGSGYSALSYLRDLPIDEVKFDRHLIAPITSDPRAAAVVRAMIDLVHALGITVVAEGVEDIATADWLRVHGCDIAQGYYFGKPVSAEAISQLMAVEVRPGN